MRTLLPVSTLTFFVERRAGYLIIKNWIMLPIILMPGVHRAFAQLKTGQKQIPILRDGDGGLRIQPKLPCILDATLSEHSLIRPDVKLREQALEINEFSIELGGMFSPLGTWHMHLNESEESLDI